ncbi:MAG: glutamate-1-semialdehyde-2,1-aminomutase [Chlamydiae bacterium]|nr:glutamate-1-semialdehyde-2,1-aminomutase [Chlamydiota bacterium]
MMTRTKSKELFDRACKCIPGGVNSPVRAFKGLNIETPLIVESGKGATLRDVDGKEYIDYCMSFGSLILGHAHPDIVKAASSQMEKSSSFGITTALEVAFAEKITSIFPSIEKMRLVSSGTEAAMTAIRLARGFTAKSKIIKFSGHYHGHSDMLLVKAGSGVASLNPVATSLGIPQSVIADTLTFAFNDFQAIRSFFRTDPRAKDVAAVILEPVTGNMGVVLPEKGFLEMLREETTKIGALLIFDEVITGFRLGLQGAQGLFGIRPDLTCLGKVISGGFPMAAVGGKKEILDGLPPLGQIYQAGTLSGNPVAVQAGLTAISLIEKPGFFESLQEKTDRLLHPIRKAVSQKNLNVCIAQAGSMCSLFLGVKKLKCREDLDKLDLQLFAKFFRFLFEKGIYLPPSAFEAWFLSAAHTNEQIDYTSKQIVIFLNEFNC